MTEKMRLDIPECRLCTLAHVGIELHPYGINGGRKHPTATHWYLCPTTGEPMTITVLEAVGQLDNQVIGFLADAAAIGRWMVMVAWIRDDGEVELRRKTNEFERDAFGKFMDLAAKDLGEEYCGVQRKQELPTVKLPPGLKLFSRFAPAGTPDASIGS